MKKIALIAMSFLVLMSARAGLRAQTPVPDAPAPQQTAPNGAAPQQSVAEKNLQMEEHQRMLGVLPAFNVVMNGSAPPLTPKQKFRLFFHSAVDPAQFGIVALDAGIEQAQGQYPSYRGGLIGYSRRYAASYADDFDGNFFGNAVLPSLLHQDPRYFRLGHGTFWHRLGYSISTTVRCKGDDGHWQFSTSNIAGNLIGGAISNAYYPREDRGFGLTMERGFTVTAEGALGSIAVEFYPDAIAWLKNRHHKHDATAAPTP